MFFTSVCKRLYLSICPSICADFACAGRPRNKTNACFFKIALYLGAPKNVSCGGGYFSLIRSWIWKIMKIMKSVWIIAYALVTGWETTKQQIYVLFHWECYYGCCFLWKPLLQFLPNKLSGWKSKGSSLIKWSLWIPKKKDQENLRRIPPKTCVKNWTDFRRISKS